MVQTAQALAQKYDVVVTNPPYMGASGMGAKLSDYVKKSFPDSKADMFAVFIERCGQMAKENGYQAMITQPSFLFLTSFERLREKTVTTRSIENLLHMGRGIFGIDFGSIAFVIKKRHLASYKGVYLRLHERTFQYIEPKDIAQLYIRAKENHSYRYSFVDYTTDDGIVEQPMTLNSKQIYYEALQDNFSKIPGSPVAYWVSEQFLKVFGSPYTIGTQAAAKKGLTTSDDATFLRFWYEVPVAAVKFNAQNTDDANLSEAIWFPLNKGGEFRRWYGNNEYVINWLNNGQNLRAFSKSVIRNEDYYFREAGSWNDIASGLVSFRYKSQGQIFNDAGPSIFGDNDTLKYLIAMGNSKVMQEICFFIAPTIHYTVGQISNTPIVYPNCNEERERVISLSDNNILLSKNDWDSFETTWDFKRNPLV